ncbi:2591_t:CDS:1, partial [Ambispora gerdemannii]
ENLYKLISTKQLFNRFRSDVIKFPTSENRHADGTDVAGIVKYLRANCKRVVRIVSSFELGIETMFF